MGASAAHVQERIVGSRHWLDVHQRAEHLDKAEDAYAALPARLR